MSQNPLNSADSFGEVTDQSVQRAWDRFAMPDLSNDSANVARLESPLLRLSKTLRPSHRAEPLNDSLEPADASDMADPN
jgi:hypothetical protein